ncbi:NAD-dependent epimerase/dehydratase family protein [Pseudomonas cavernae]|uniref:NAD-dependent epimerase/dehydratase family protein n=1 Tax=Pseudomonas cavernae TaxID=2320867 RepID=A0A385YXT9_9PSED|nr:NAD-dependent epimerase/dehydratase family protein [Pseudomonas cavernae]AYC31749.1 NAD-dependent epimerase/dehydratase family protein [Pseudomonas cavernae]
MKIGVLGATGLLGHHAARAVRAGGHQLVLIHRPSSRIERLVYLEPECRSADLLDHQALTRALSGLDGVIFSAGYYPTKPRRWQDEVASALNQSNHFYAACLAARVPRILYVGAAIALPRHPQGLPGHEGLFYEDMPRWRNDYLLCKWALDEQASEQARNGLPVVIGIPGMCLGEFDVGPTTGRLITAIGNGVMRRYVPGRRNLIDAADAGRGLLLALERGRVGERYLLIGHNLDMRELTERIATRLGVAPPQPLSLSAAKLLAGLGRLRYRLTGKLAMLDDTTIAVMAGGQFLDGRKARDELGFVAETSLDATLERTIQWFRDNGYLR